MRVEGVCSESSEVQTHTGDSPTPGPLPPFQFNQALIPLLRVLVTSPGGGACAGQALGMSKTLVSPGQAASQSRAVEPPRGQGGCPPLLQEGASGPPRAVAFFISFSAIELWILLGT